MQRLNSLAIRLSLTMFMLSSCSFSTAGPAELVDGNFNFKSKEKQPFEPGHEEPICGSVTNKGGAFKGVIVTLSGSAVTTGVIAMPITSKSKVQNVYSSRKDLVMSSAKPSFFQLDKDTLEAKIPELQCEGDTIEVELVVPMVNRGKGDVTLTVAPLDQPDKASKTVFPVQVYKASGLLLGS